MAARKRSAKEEPAQEPEAPPVEPAAAAFPPLPPLPPELLPPQLGQVMLPLRKLNITNGVASYSRENAEAICELVMQGLGTRQISQRLGVARVTIWDWQRKHDEFRVMFNEAKQIALQLMAEDLVDIADDGSNDLKITENGNEVVDNEVVQRSKLRIDTRKWLLERLLAQYGNKSTLEHTGPGGGPVRSINVNMTAKEAAEVYQNMIRGGSSYDMKLDEDDA